MVAWVTCSSRTLTPPLPMIRPTSLPGIVICVVRRPSSLPNQPSCFSLSKIQNCAFHWDSGTPTIVTRAIVTIIVSFQSYSHLWHLDLHLYSLHRHFPLVLAEFELDSFRRSHLGARKGVKLLIIDGITGSYVDSDAGSSDS